MTLKIPQKPDGSVPSYDDATCFMVDSFEFGATLEILGFRRGRSSANLILKGGRGETYSMFPTEWVKMLKEGYVAKGFVSGFWGFRKQGANYTLTWRSGR